MNFITSLTSASFLRQIIHILNVFSDISGVMDHKDVEDKKQTRGLRRAFGAAGKKTLVCHLKVVCLR